MAARTGASSISRPPRPCGRSTRSGIGSRRCATASTLAECSATPTSSACSDLALRSHRYIRREPVSEPMAASDEGINQSFGYKQELRRALRLFSLYAVAFSIISITTGLFANYGFGLQHLGAAMIWLWPVAAAGQMLIALVVAEVGAAGINFVVVAPIIATILNLDASNPTINLVITVVVFAAVLAVNIISIALASRVNNVAVFTEIAGMVGFGLILFVLWAIHPNHLITFLGDTGGVHGGDILLALPYAALMG